MLAFVVLAMWLCSARLFSSLARSSMCPLCIPFSTTPRLWRTSRSRAVSASVIPDLPRRTRRARGGGRLRQVETNGSCSRARGNRHLLVVGRQNGYRSLAVAFPGPRRATPLSRSGDQAAARTIAPSRGFRQPLSSSNFRSGFHVRRALHVFRGDAQADARERIQRRFSTLISGPTVSARTSLQEFGSGVGGTRGCDAWPGQIDKAGWPGRYRRAHREVVEKKRARRFPVMWTGRLSTGCGRRRKLIHGLLATLISVAPSFRFPAALPFLKAAVRFLVLAVCFTRSGRRLLPVSRFHSS